MMKNAPETMAYQFQWNWRLGNFQSQLFCVRRHMDNLSVSISFEKLLRVQLDSFGDRFVWPLKFSNRLVIIFGLCTKLAYISWNKQTFFSIILETLKNVLRFWQRYGAKSYGTKSYGAKATKMTDSARIPIRVLCILVLNVDWLRFLFRI